jgi:hypothetical protein
MEAAARIATSLLLALAVASTFLCDGAHGGRGGRRHATRRTRHDSSWPTTTSAQNKRGALPRARRRRGRVRSSCTTSSRASAPPGTAWRTTPARSRPRGAPRAGAARRAGRRAAGRTFLVRATVFRGPCQGNVTLQVMHLRLEEKMQCFFARTARWMLRSSQRIES